MRERALFSTIFLIIFLVSFGKSENTTDTSTSVKTTTTRSLNDFVMQENCTLNDIMVNVVYTKCQTLEEILCGCTFEETSTTSITSTFETTINSTNTKLSSETSTLATNSTPASEKASSSTTATSPPSTPSTTETSTSSATTGVSISSTSDKTTSSGLPSTTTTNEETTSSATSELVTSSVLSSTQTVPITSDKTTSSSVSSTLSSTVLTTTESTSSSSTSTPMNSGGEIIDSENRITYPTTVSSTLSSTVSTPSSSTSMPMNSGGEIIDSENIVTYPTTVSSTLSSTVSTPSSSTSMPTNSGGEIIDSENRITHTTASVTSTRSAASSESKSTIKTGQDTVDSENLLTHPTVSTSTWSHIETTSVLSSSGKPSTVTSETTSSKSTFQKASSSTTTTDPPTTESSTSSATSKMATSSMPTTSVKTTSLSSSSTTTTNEETTSSDTSEVVTSSVLSSTPTMPTASDKTTLLSSPSTTTMNKATTSSISGYSFTSTNVPYPVLDYANSTDLIFLYNEYWDDEEDNMEMTTVVSPMEIIDVGQVVNHSTVSQKSSTSMPINSGGEIIDTENRITYSTASGETSTTKKSGQDIVDTGNVLTHPTASSQISESSTTTQKNGAVDSSSTTGNGLVDVSQVITHSTSSLSESTSTAPWTEHAKAADSVISTTSQDDSNVTKISSDSSDSSTSSGESTANISTVKPITTTLNPSCLIQCPVGYIAGTSLCYHFAELTSIKSYQSALSYCQNVDLRNLISLEHLRNLNDLQILREKSGAVQSTSWYFANGGGSVQERFDKEAQVFDINMLTAMTSPIAMTVGISDATSNTSAICVLPQYCNISQCYVETALNVLELNTILSSSEETIDSHSTTSITCSYTKSVTSISCGIRGNMMPNPTTISCEAIGAAQKLRNTTAQIVENCSMCYNRGTETCDEATDENGKNGYKCNCKSAYSMSTCWYTSDSCTSDTCNGHGKCSDTLGDMKCDCDWGYEGDRCEVNKDRVTNTTDSFFTRLGNYIIDFPTIYALQTNTWTFLTIFAKSLGKIYISNGEDDPQETHQAARAFFMTLGTSCVLFFNDPYLFKISQATCRMFFILIHFCFMGALIQWMLEGYNANQIVRCVHLNEWERNFENRRAWGIMAAPRLVIPLILMAVALAVMFQSNWWYLPSTWTCVGVICNQTTSVWLSAIWIVLCLVASTAAFAESSVLLKFRRPLYNLKIRQQIERNVGVLDGWVAEKCRRNTVLCFIGICLLSLTWLFTILASDKRSKYFFGWSLTVVSTVYGVFSFVQGLYTDPNVWSSILWLAMKKLPARFAPSYDPISMWTREEVKEIQKLPKDERSIMKEQMLPLNKRLFLHHKWDMMLNEKLETGTEITEALLEILRNEIKRHQDLSGTKFQKEQLQETFSEFVKSIADRPPRMDLLGVQAKSEAVTLCAEKEDGTARVSKFMLVPDIDVFEPEEYYEDADDVDKKRMNNEVDKETYKIAREEAVSQNNFMNSAIKFKYYGKIKA